MAIKLIALDMDNTLLNRQKLVSKKNEMIIKKVIKKGVYVTIATGRMPASASYFAKNLGLNCPVISCNGGVVKPLDGSKPIFEVYFSPETLLELIETCYKYDWYIRWYIDDTIYVKCKDERMFSAYKTTKGLHIVEVGDDYKKYINNVTQLVICDINGKIQGIYHYIAEVFKDKIGLQQNTGFTMDVTPPGINKAVGLAKLADYLGIKQEQVMAIGDGDNDLSMIQYAGCGVAMDNAIADLKAEASFITKDCDEDGIAYAIEKLVL